MAFPVVESTATTGRTAAETTSPITYPATVSPNALLVAIVRVTVAGAIGWPVEWTELVEDSSDASDDVTAIAYRVADGTEDGLTFNVTHGSGKLAGIVYSITGAADPAVQAPQLSTVATGTSASPDPTGLTPTGGAKDYLWLWLGVWEGEQTSPPTGNPTNYSTPLGASTGTGGAITTNCRVASAQRSVNQSTEDPGLWTISVSDDWSAWVMAVHPASTDRRAQVSWAEVEIPDAPRRVQLSWAELETPDQPRRGQISWVELEVPDVGTDRRGQVSWAELEVPDAPRRAQVSWAELETPDIPRRGQISWVELETPDAPRRAQASWAELEVPLLYTAHGMPFLFTTAEWSGGVFTLEVYMRAITGTVFARLFNVTDTAAVAGSDLSTTSVSFARLRSGALTLTTAKEYRVQFAKDGSGEFLGAQLLYS